MCYISVVFFETQCTFTKLCKHLAYAISGAIFPQKCTITDWFSNCNVFCDSDPEMWPRSWCLSLQTASDMNVLVSTKKALCTSLLWSLDIKMASKITCPKELKLYNKCEISITLHHKPRQWTRRSTVTWPHDITNKCEDYWPPIHELWHISCLSFLRNGDLLISASYCSAVLANTCKSYWDKHIVAKFMTLSPLVSAQ